MDRPNRSRAALTATLVLLGSQAAARAHVPLQTFTLDNGLRVVVSEDASAPVVAVHLWYGAGSAHEEPGMEGLARLAQAVSLEAARAPDRRSARELVAAAGGTLEAAVGPDHSEIRQVVPAHRVELAFWTLERVLGEPRLQAAEVARQRRALEAQARRGGAERPAGRVRVLLDSLASGHVPYARATELPIPSAAVADTAAIRAFLRRHHVPGRALLVAVGAVTADSVRRLATRTLGQLPTGPGPGPRGPEATLSTPRPPSPDGARARRLELVDPGIPFPLVWVGYALPPGSHPDHAALALLASILADDAGRLQARLVEERGVAAGIASLRRARIGPGLLAFGGATGEGASAEALEAGLVEEIERVAREGVSERELEEARRRVEAAEIGERLSADGRAAALARATLLFGDPRRADTLLRQVRKVGPEELARVAARYLAQPYRAVVVVRPAGNAHPGAGL